MKIRINEQELHDIIAESVKKCLNEGLCKEEFENNEEMEEGFFKDKFNQAKAAGSTMFGNNNGNLSQRFNNAKKNFQTQGKVNDLSNLKNMLEKYVEERVLDPNMTIAQLIGNTFMRKGDRQGLKQRIGGFRGNMTQRGGKSYVNED